MRGDKPRWLKKKSGTWSNMSIGSNCRCWMCQAVMKWIDQNHWTTGREREKLAEKLLTYLCYRMGYSGCDDINIFEKTLPRLKREIKKELKK